MEKERRLIIAGNWKMNKTVADALDLLHGLKLETKGVKEVDIVVCPPFTALSEVSKAIIDSNMRLGAQNMSENNYGAHTGEIAAGMNGNLCRCNGYIKVVKAIRRAADTMRGESHG